MPRNLLAVPTIALVTMAFAQVAASQDSKTLTVEFPEVGQVCLSKEEAQDFARRLREVVVPVGSAATIVAYSDENEVTRKRPGLTSECISHLVPTGIADHERIAVFRALQIAEIAQEAGLKTFDGTPILIIGAASNFRQRDPNSFAIISRRGQGTTTLDRRVDIFFSDGLEGGATASFNNGGGSIIMTPILLPPIAYGGGGDGGGGGGGGTIIFKDDDDGSGQRVAGWTFVSLSLVALTGGVFSFIQASDSASLSRRTVDTQQAISFQDDADLFNQVGGWSTGLGVGLAVLGIVLVASAPDDAPEEETSVFLAPSPDGTGAAVFFRAPLLNPSW